jgi:hypothetical protein
MPPAGSVAKFILSHFSGQHDVTKSLEIGHLTKIIKHCLCFESGFRNGTSGNVMPRVMNVDKNPAYPAAVRGV